MRVHPCVCKLCMCVCVSVFAWLPVSFCVCVILQARGPLCITNCCNPQQTGTKISTLWAVWLKLFMPRHCEPSPPPPCSNRKVRQKHTALVMQCYTCCGVPSACHCFFYLTLWMSLFTRHIQHEWLSATIKSAKTGQVVILMTTCCVTKRENNY